MLGGPTYAGDIEKVIENAAYLHLKNLGYKIRGYIGLGIMLRKGKRIICSISQWTNLAHRELTSMI